MCGCASISRPIDPTAKIDTKKGILLAAVTSDGEKLVMDAWFFYRPKGTNEELRLDAFGELGLIMKPNDFKGKDSSMGRLLAVSLNPGEYELFYWMLYYHNYVTNNYLEPTIPPPPHSFTIRAGEITYLGDLHIDTILGKGPFGLPVVSGGNPDITDQIDRDLPVLKEKYPNIANWPLQSSIPDPTQWHLEL